VKRGRGALINKLNFYPTPKHLIAKMWAKVKNRPNYILEPSAGKGDICEYLKSQSRAEREVCAIEIDPELRAVLSGKGIKVIDTDFLTYSGPDKFDLIIANPPFDFGVQHLLKAIDIMYSGEIVFLLNAETLKNPYTNIRKKLVVELKKLNADIEYIQEAFKDSERPTGVEIVLIHIVIERVVEEDLFQDCGDTTSKGNDETLEENYEVATKSNIFDLVAEYNQIILIGTQTLIDYYTNYKKIGSFIRLNRSPDKHAPTSGKVTDMMKDDLNELLKVVRVSFWRKTLLIPEVIKRMTAKKKEEFEKQLQIHSNLDFTENNIRQFILNLVDNYEQTLIEAVLDIFDKFTIRHTWSDDNLYDDNIHYFNGWKTNKAFKVGKKVIIPVHARYYSSPFIDDFSGNWKLAYGIKDELDDIDKVMNYFDGMSDYHSISDAIEVAFVEGVSRKIKSTYFTITCYKKGTIHLVFNDTDILRRFNVVACRGKNWLPHEYGCKEYSDFSKDEQSVVNDFEGAISYTKHLKQPLFVIKKDILKLT